MTEDGIQLYLASASPRRRELLDQLGLRYRVIPQRTDESLLAGEDPESHVRRLACAKAAAGRRGLAAGEDIPVLGADTVVVCRGRLLGKPRDSGEALEMLGLLSGTVHRVLTAVALENAKGSACRVSRTTVEFRPLSGQEIEAYWETGEPRGKAGAYAIQGLGALFVSRLSGSYSGVVGLPVFETAQLLEEFGMETASILQGRKA